jgi:hypothetical protein
VCPKCAQPVPRLRAQLRTLGPGHVELTVGCGSGSGYANGVDGVNTGTPSILTGGPVTCNVDLWHPHEIGSSSIVPGYDNKVCGQSRSGFQTFTLPSSLARRTASRHSSVPASKIVTIKPSSKLCRPIGMTTHNVRRGDIYTAAARGATAASLGPSSSSKMTVSTRPHLSRSCRSQQVMSKRHCFEFPCGLRNPRV